MKFTKELPQTNKELAQKLAEDGWKKIKEPNSLLLAVLLSFPLSCLLLVMTIYIAYVLEPQFFSFITSDSLEITILLGPGEKGQFQTNRKGQSEKENTSPSLSETTILGVS